MKIVAVIPARMGSSRFPGKPLAPILGRSMIEHVYRRTMLCADLDAVYVATCDTEIRDVVEGFGGDVIMTSSTHQRASDRVAEAATHLEADVVVMVQGDEAMVTPEMITTATRPLLADTTIACVNLAKRVTTEAEFHDPNCIKVVMDRQGFALYFSRQPIPTTHVLGFAPLTISKQVCIIPFQREALITFAHLESTPLEQAESVDMLRFLEHGYRVKLVETQTDTHAVDTPSDLTLVEQLMQQDALLLRYA
jgi:3-deoxy-manno-octulosonate cytidylyltransferase (CMP-KDO synthetase)